MGTQKSRDLAQELVDFLLKEDQQKTSASSTPPVPEIPEIPKVQSTKPAPPKPAQAKAPKDEMKTLVLEEHGKESPSDMPTKGDTRAVTKKIESPDGIVEFTALDKLKERQDPVLEPVNFTAPSEKSNEIIAGAEKPEHTKTEEFNFQPTTPQGFTTQRSKMVFNEVSTLMAGTEAVKVAQARITVLEKERDRLRDEAEQLLTASEALTRRLQELKAQHESLERKHKEKIEILEDEKAVLKGRLKAREDELDQFKKENDELKNRFQSDLRKIRVRERELEARQEILRAEHGSVLKVKDETILELKRHSEKLQFELENFKNQTAELNAAISEFHEKNHRTVKALRLALSVLETGDLDEKTKKVG